MCNSFYVFSNAIGHCVIQSVFSNVMRQCVIHNPMTIYIFRTSKQPKNLKSNGTGAGDSATTSFINEKECL